MLNTFLKILSSSNPESKINPNKKHLVMEKVYVNLSLLKKRDALLNQPEFKEVTIEALDKDVQLLCLKKPQMLQGDFVMYEYSQDSNSPELQILQKQADQQNVDVIICKTKQKMQCLKLTKKNDNILYLVDKKSVIAVKPWRL